MALVPSLDRNSHTARPICQCSPEVSKGEPEGGWPCQQVHEGLDGIFFLDNHPPPPLKPPDGPCWLAGEGLSHRSPFQGMWGVA